MTNDLTYFAKQKKNWKYQIFGKQSFSLLIDDYLTKIDEKYFLLWIEQYYWKDIEWYLKLIEENFVLLWKDWTNKITETKLWFKIKKELDELELEAFVKWRFFLDDVDFTKQEIDLDFVLNLHRFLFSDLYIWAGEFRKVDVKFWDKEWEKPFRIRESLIILFDDIDFNLKNLDIGNKRELAKTLASFEYRFILIHPFLNTNGRFARLLINAYLISLWYNNTIEYSTLTDRENYLKNMRDYDNWNKEWLENLIYNLIIWI
jgi:cell filamentation protein